MQTVKVCGALSLGAAIFATFGCAGPLDHDERELRDSGKEMHLDLSNRQSGYRPGQSWMRFVNCWQSSLPRTTQGVSVGSTLSVHSEASSQPAGQVRVAEGRLGFKLPPSYRDFLLQVKSQPRTPDSQVGMFPPEQVDVLNAVAPHLLEEARRWAVESPGPIYFRYGIDQDSASGRFSNLESAIVVGRYGESAYELILLYPTVRTSDGEMEAAIQFHAGEFRAPSFAELMRQLSHQEITDSVRNPPFSQTDVNRSCAAELPLSDVWWK